MYDKESALAYDPQPRLEISDLKYGDVINLTPGTLPWNPIVRLAYGEIIHENQADYGIPFHTSIHSWFHTGYGRIFQVDTSGAHFGLFDLRKLDPKRWYPVCRYRWSGLIDATGREYLWACMKELEGTPYDFGQLMAILCNKILGWPQDEYLPIFDFCNKWKVCSVLARGLLMSWYELVKHQFDYIKRPGGPLHVERTPPGLFENHSETFQLIGVLNGGAGRTQ